MLRSITVCLVLALSLGAGALTAGAQPSPGIPGLGANDDGSNVFELDGNAMDDGAGKDDDWANVLDGLGTNGDFTIIARTECESGCQTGWPGVLVDPRATSIFVQGSKDILDIDTGWTCRDQNAPDKDELSEAYAVAYEVNGELIAYMGTARYANNGTATMGFWLLQADIAQPSCLPSGDGKFRNSTGDLVEHANGDLLVVADFTNGGAVGDILIFEWLNGALVLQFEAAAGDEGADCTAGTPGNVCGTINQAPVTSPWEYIPKGATGDSDFIQYGFMEIGVNLSSIFNGTGEVPCFSTFLAETRSSAEPNASQKDFVLGSFNVCSIDVTKECDVNEPNLTTDPISFDYTIGGCIDNTGFGSVTNIGITDNPAFESVTLYRSDPEPTDAECASSAALGAIVADTLNYTTEQLDPSDVVGPGERVFYIGTVNSTTNMLYDVVTATADGSGGAQIEDATDDDTCPQAVFNPELSVTKSCDTYLYDAGSSLVVKVDISGTVCNEGDVTLKNVAIYDTTNATKTLIATIGTLPAQADPDNPDCVPSATNHSAVDYNATYTPSAIPSDPFITFSDSVQAEGFPPAGVAANTNCPLINGVVTCIATTSATCPLCPTCSDLNELCVPD